VAALNKCAIVDEVKRLLPDVKAIALTGSAAYSGERFKADSDIDVIAINPRQCMAWGEVSGHELVIGAWRMENINQLARNPQWHGAGWVWRVGMIASAETLYGPSLAIPVRSQITKRTWLIAASGLVGLLLLAQQKARSGRRPQLNEGAVDVPFVLTALRRVLSGALPIRCEPDEDLNGMGALSDFSGELEGAKKFAAEHLETLRDNTALAKITYHAATRAGLCWMRKAMNIDVAMPNISTST
jgi:hypothetical protein